jgi:hypothetical protein
MDSSLKNLEIISQHDSAMAGFVLAESNHWGTDGVDLGCGIL